MKFGYFDDHNREYVITTPKTPLPWINYLGCRDFFSLISNTGGGYSFYKDAKLLRLTRYRYNNIPVDSNGKYFYLKDDGITWNPGFMPTKTELDTYECRHGLGYSRFTATKNNLKAELLSFVPVDENCEIMQLKLTNQSAGTKLVKLFSFVEWCLWNADDDMKNFQRNLSIGEVEVSGSAIYHKTEYRERRNHYAVFSVNTEIDGFDTSRDTFLGAFHDLSSPAVIENGTATGSIAHGWSPIAAHQINITLEPGASSSYIFVLGYLENSGTDKWASPGVINKKAAATLLSHYQTDAAVDAAFQQLNDYWHRLLSAYQLESQHAKVNRMVNIWNQYQCMVTFNLSRSASYYESGIGRGMGFRDSCQDLLGFVHLIPDRARERILDIAATQFEDGSTYHQYQPLTKQGNSDIGSGFHDDPLWLIAAVSAYIRETGDLDILNEAVPFDNKIETEKSLFDHLRCSFDYIAGHKGPHLLPLIGRADWNDCLNLNCFSENPGESFQTFGTSEGAVAESVFIAGMFVKYGSEYAELCQLIGNEAEAANAFAEVDQMKAAILKHGWDGEWFLRAYDANSDPVGSCHCKEGRIYIEPQGFCVFAGVGLAEGFAHKALKAVAQYLDTPYGIMLLQPAYCSYHLELGEISSYPPGYKENAGIFCHNNPWISIAETVLGHGDRAFDIYKKTCPAYLEEISELHKTEPYVYAQMIAGADAAIPGEAKNSWLTGTAAWTFVNISQYILGIYPTYHGLLVKPCLPNSFGNLKIQRKFREGTYYIEIVNTDPENKPPYMTVDGQLTAGNIIPYQKGKTEYHVVVAISSEGNTK